MGREKGKRNNHRFGGRIYPEDYPPCFASRLEELLIRNDISNRAFAESIFVSYHLISYWLTQVREPKIEIILLICKTYNITPNWILGWEE